MLLRFLRLDFFFKHMSEVPLEERARILVLYDRGLIGDFREADVGDNGRVEVWRNGSLTCCEVLPKERVSELYYFGISAKFSEGADMNEVAKKIAAGEGIPGGVDAERVYQFTPDLEDAMRYNEEGVENMRKELAEELAVYTGVRVLDEKYYPF